MATYYDGLNDFYKLNEMNPLASSAQLVYLHLLQLNNRLGNGGQLQISDRELGYRTRLSKQTVTESKRTLKNRGLIDFKRDSGATIYTLTFFSEKVGQEVGQTVGHKVGQEVGQTVGQSYSNNITNNISERRNKIEIETPAHEKIDELMDSWERAGGAKLNQLLVSKLAALLDKYPLTDINRALEKAATSANNPHYGFSFKFLLSKLAEISAKGGEKNHDYETPRRSSEMPWAEY